jgi:hypothetical protein
VRGESEEEEEVKNFLVKPRGDRVIISAGEALARWWRGARGDWREREREREIECGGRRGGRRARARLNFQESTHCMFDSRAR